MFFYYFFYSRRKKLWKMSKTIPLLLPVPYQIQTPQPLPLQQVSKSLLSILFEILSISYFWVRAWPLVNNPSCWIFVLKFSNNKKKCCYVYIFFFVLLRLPFMQNYPVLFGMLIKLFRLSIILGMELVTFFFYSTWKIWLHIFQ